MANGRKGFPFGGAIGERQVRHGRVPYTPSAPEIARAATTPGTLTGAGFLGGLPGFTGGMPGFTGIMPGFAGVLSGGLAGGFGWTGWAITFVVLFFVGLVLWNVWGSVGPLLGGLGAFF